MQSWYLCYGTNLHIICASDLWYICYSQGVGLSMYEVLEGV